MKNILILTFLLSQSLFLFAQKKEQHFDYWFKPTQYQGRYYVITEKKDSLWHRQAYFLPEKSMAMQAWYKDEEGKIPHGEEIWYHTSKYAKSQGSYINGKKEGAWFGFDEQGILIDSANYVNGRLKGVRLQWYSDGAIQDSSNF